MSVPYPQKSFAVDVPVTSSPSSSSKILSHPALAPAVNLYARFAEWRASLGLSSPGTMENLQKEVKSTQLTNFMFDGARADLTKALSLNPTFSVTHSFAMGSQTQEPTYSFNAAYMSPKTFLQGMIDHGGNLNGRFHQSWSPNNMTKVQLQLGSLAERSMVQLEQDYTGSDYSVNLKAINPSPVDGTGLYFGSYLQSLTKNIALGVESLWQRAYDGEDMSASYILKYTSTKQDWIATATVQPQGMLNTTYWHKLSEKLDVAAELQVIAAPQKRDALASVAAKWDLRMATFRAQLDSTGKVSALLEQRFAPSFAFLVAGEIDHFKGSAKVGVGVMVESSSLTPEEMGLGPQM